MARMADNLDQYFDRTMTETYNCLDHVREVWRELKGEDLLGRLPKLHGAFRHRSISIVGARTFRRLTQPESPCIVLMQKPKERPHIGVYYKRSVMHLGAAGVEYQPLAIATRDYKQVRFYV
jgi:hypothetical protein